MIPLSNVIIILAGVGVTIFLYWIGAKVYRLSGHASFLHPNIFSMVVLVALLVLFRLPYETTYRPAGDAISFFLRPAVVVLAIPLYRNLRHLLGNKTAILSGVVAGMVMSALSVTTLSLVFGLEYMLALSLLPKSITTPMAIETSTAIGGVVPVTVISVILTGVLGALLARRLYPLFGIHHPVAKGIAIGTASHALGTSKALELGPTEGAMSGLALALCGLMTVFFLPLFVIVMRIFFCYF